MINHIYIVLFLIYFVFINILCYTFKGKSVFYLTSNIFRKLEASQRSLITCLPIWWQEYKDEYKKKYKMVAEELVKE